MQFGLPHHHILSVVLYTFHINGLYSFFIYNNAKDYVYLIYKVNPMKIGVDLGLKISKGIQDFMLQHSYPSVELEDGFDKPFLHGGSISSAEENSIAKKDA